VLSPLLFNIYIDRISKEANQEISAICERYNMKINKTKTEIVKVGRTHGPLNIYLDNTPLKQVQEFKYLGSVITEDGRMDREIETEMQKSKHTYISTDTITDTSKHTDDFKATDNK
jgi:hypothetical protein